MLFVIMLAVYGVRLSVCPVGIFSMTHQRAAGGVASVHCGRTIRRTDVQYNTISNLYSAAIQLVQVC